MRPPDACPCGSERSYAQCCQPLHRGERKAVTAEALMRSRYAAFSRGEVDYLIETWHPDKRGELDRRSLAASSQAIRWVGLRIVDTVAGAELDDAGIVEFEASYVSGSTTGIMHERSRFVRVDGAWYYVDGETPARPRALKQGRNEACACGSGKKFKRCCGA